MGLTLTTTTAGEIDVERIRLARNRIDLTGEGALGALYKLDSEKATPVAYEALAKEYPLVFDGGIRPATDEELNYALGILRKRNEGDKALLSIRTGAEIGYDEPPRLESGSLVLDWLMGGGFPRGYVTQLKGQESSGKTFAALKTCTGVLQMGGAVLWMAAERFNKPWARQLGVPIHYSGEELGSMAPDAQEAATHYNEIHPEGLRMGLTTGRAGNDILNTIVDAILLNAWDLIVLDSIAVLKRALILDGKTVGDQTRGGEAVLFNDFCSRLEANFNAVESQAGKSIAAARQYECSDCGESFPAKKDHLKCPKTGKKAKLDTIEKVGVPVRTAIIVINQLRDRGLDGYGQSRPDAPGGRGLRHTKGVEIEFEPGMALQVDHEGRSVSYGKRTQITCRKSKVGPPERTGVLELHYEDVAGVCRKGDYSLWVDLFGAEFKGQKAVGLAEVAGLVRQSGAYYYLGDKRFHGQKAFEDFLLNPKNMHIVQAMRAQLAQWIRKGY